MNILESNEIVYAQACINIMSPGIYELKQIIGDNWSHISSPCKFGVKFKRAVSVDLLTNIKYHSRTPTNHLVYEVST